MRYWLDENYRWNNSLTGEEDNVIFYLSIFKRIVSRDSHQGDRLCHFMGLECATAFMMLLQKYLQFYQRMRAFFEIYFSCTENRLSKFNEIFISPVFTRTYQLRVSFISRKITEVFILHKIIWSTFYKRKNTDLFHSTFRLLNCFHYYVRRLRIQKNWKMVGVYSMNLHWLFKTL